MSDPRKWVSEDFTHSAVYLPEFDLVRYSYPDDDDGAPGFRSALLDREVALGIVSLFLNAEVSDE